MDKEIEHRFSYHPPKPGQPETYEKIRAHAKSLAYRLDGDCPPSRERSIAMTKLDEVVFWANAAIARHEAQPSEREAGHPEPTV